MITYSEKIKLYEWLNYSIANNVDDNAVKKRMCIIISRHAGGFLLQKNEFLNFTKEHLILFKTIMFSIEKVK